MTITVGRRLVLGGLVALPACRSSNKRFDADVIILGAGLSGLHAARLLEAEGKDVLVLEGANRIGGRLHTLDHSGRGYTEGGGEQVGASYARIIDTARQLNLTLTLDESPRRETAYFYQNKLMGPDGWKDLELHPFSPPFKGMSPGSTLFKLAAIENPLTTPQDWQDARFADFDISADDFLKSQGLNDEARRVIGVALNGNSLETYSMMNLYRSLQLYSQSKGMGPSLSIKGGAQRLPEAMANSLKRPVRTGHIARQISETPTAVEVTTQSGKTYRASHCICTLPYGALHRVTMSAPTSPSQDKAIDTLPYTQIYQIHFEAGTAFWEIDKLPADMWTDSPIERVFANLDNNGRPTGIFRAWTNGMAATQWAASSEPAAQFKSLFERIRPASSGDINVLGTQNWTQTNPLAGGAYMHWAPRQIQTLAKSMGQATERLLFAGEHLSFLHTGMEGAMESAENAAFSLLDI